MKAMILAAGVGSRLGAITERIPKCLVEVAGRPMLAHVIERLRHAGVDELVINVHHKADLVREYLESRNSFDIPIHISHEPQLLDTGGGVKAVESLLSDGPFLLHNCDVFTSIDLVALFAAHLASDATATVAVMERQTSRVLLFDDEGLNGWRNNATGRESMVRVPPHGPVAQLAFACVHAVSPDVFNYMRQEPEVFSVIDFYLRAARAGASILPFRVDGSEWCDIGTPQQLAQLQARFP